MTMSTYKYSNHKLTNNSSFIRQYYKRPCPRLCPRLWVVLVNPIPHWVWILQILHYLCARYVPHTLGSSVRALDFHGLKTSVDTIFCSQGPYQRQERLWHTNVSKYSTLKKLKVESERWKGQLSKFLCHVNAPSWNSTMSIKQGQECGIPGTAPAHLLNYDLTIKY